MASDPGFYPEKVAAWAEQIAPELAYCDLDVFPLARRVPGEADDGRHAPGVPHGIHGRGPRAGADAGDRHARGLSRAEPLASAGRGRKQKELAAEFNRDRIRWVSQVELRPGEPYLLRIPADRQEAGFGLLCIWFEWTGELGGTSMSKHLPIGLADPREARRMMDRWHLDRHRHQNFVEPLPERIATGGYGTYGAATTPFAGGRLPPRRQAGEG